jgi:agmatine deiminase
MPAEWEAQEAIWLAWPHNAGTWPGEALVEARRCYGRIVGELSPEQTVRILVGDADQEEDARGVLAASGATAAAVEFFHLPTCDTWIRDYGPTFVVNQTQRTIGMVSWTYNAWGGKYPELMADDGMPARMARFLDCPVFEAGIVLEGGSIEVDGRGRVLTTEQCLLHANRNPGLGRAEIEAILGEFLGVDEVIWLGEGIVGDDTDGHVDDIARFVDANTVVCALEDDPADANYLPLRDNYDRLSRYRDRRGRSLRVVALPMPAPFLAGAGRLPASYANFYIGRRSVLVPTFGDPRDRAALRVLEECFPGRRVVGVDCRALVAGLGTIHCCSQQQPDPHALSERA